MKTRRRNDFTAFLLTLICACAAPAAIAAEASPEIELSRQQSILHGRGQ